MNDSLNAPETPVIHPGDMVAATVDAQRTAFKALLVPGTKEVVVDLAGVMMVDSTGIGLLIQVHNTLAKTGGRLAIRHASENILGLFKSMRLDSRFNIHG